MRSDHYGRSSKRGLTLPPVSASGRYVRGRHAFSGGHSGLADAPLPLPRRRARQRARRALPRVGFPPSGTGSVPCGSRRLQFPVRLAFALAIIKYRGQTLDHVGVYLRSPVFAHGHLQVALSLCTPAPEHVHILVPPPGDADAPADHRLPRKRAAGQGLTRNVVVGGVFHKVQCLSSTAEGLGRGGWGPVGAEAALAGAQLGPKPRWLGPS